MAKPGLGATISIAGTTPAEIYNITPPEMLQEIIDVTTHTDTSRVKMRTIKDLGDTVVQMYYVANSATDTACIAALAATTATTTVITTKAAAGNSTRTYSGIATNYKVDDLTIDGAQTASLTLAGYGAVVQA